MATLTAYLVLVVLLGTVKPLSGSTEQMYYWSQVLGPTVVIISVFLLAWQLRDLRRSQDAQNFDATSRRLSEMQDSMIASPELYEFFYEGRPAEDAEPLLRAKVLLMAELRLDLLDGELMRKEALGWYHGQIPSLEAWIEDSFRDSPAMRQLVELHPSWYRPELISIAKRATPHEPLEKPRAELDGTV